MDEQLQATVDEFFTQLVEMTPKKASAAGTRDPKKVLQMRMIGAGLASNLMFYGMMTNNEPAQRWGNYINNQINDPVKWEELLTAIYGPA